MEIAIKIIEATIVTPNPKTNFLPIFMFFTRTALLRAALGSVADRAIIPMYDWLGLGEEAHLNTPGKLGGNWAWRAAAGFESKTLAKTIADECSVYCRV